MTQPLVSICIPAYEQTQYLEKLLESLLIQTFTNFEVILTDDSKTDAVAVLVEKYQKALGDKLLYIRNKPGLGSPENWNKAIGLAKGKWIKLMHHDDWFTYPDSLMEFVHLAQQNPDKLICSAILKYYPQQDSYYVHYMTPEQKQLVEQMPAILILVCYIGLPSCTIYAKQIAQEFDPKLIWMVDIEFYMRTLYQNPGLAYSNRPLITSASYATHNITNQFIHGNPKELEELFHIYVKLNHQLVPESRKKVLKKIGYKVIQYGFSDLKSIKQTYPQTSFPKWLQVIIRINKYSKLLAKVLLKIV